MLKTVYLSGPLSDCSPAEINVWRDRVIECGSRIEKSYSNRVKFRFIKPKPADFDATYHAVVDADKKNILGSDLVMAFPWTDSIGTAMEVMFASIIKTPVVLFHDNTWNLSPWYREHATCVGSNIDDTAQAESEILDSAMLWLNSNFDTMVEDTLRNFIRV